MRSNQKILKQPPLPPNSKTPDVQFFENFYKAKGFSSIAGIDEAGRGCIAGPVVAAAVILDWTPSLEGLKDSKLLSAKKRDYFYNIITEQCKDFAIGVIGSKEVDSINILQAALKAMRQSLDSLEVIPNLLLIDGRESVQTTIPQRPIIRGDSLSYSISAASVLAKVTRDRLMEVYEGDYPNFNFAKHKGYGTKQHWEELKEHGPTQIHRFSFRGVC